MMFWSSIRSESKPLNSAGYFITSRYWAEKKKEYQTERNEKKRDKFTHFLEKAVDVIPVQFVT
jgi:hypothetical protein